jgi:predicted transcriptional regulator
MAAGSGPEAIRMIVEVRLDRGLMRQVDHFAVDADTSRWAAMERLIQKGLEAERYHHAIRDDRGADAAGPIARVALTGP